MHTNAEVTHAPSNRTGFTLVEMMMAVLLTMLVFAITVPFFRMQTNAINTGAGREDALMNARYAQNAMDREVRLAGGVTGQPIIVQASAFSITFNVDLVSRVVGDPNATYYNPSADSLSSESWEVSRAKALPTVSKVYPAQMYNDANGVQSPAETISFFALVDASTGRSDIYTLFRRVNDRDSTVVSRNLWIPADTANYMFKYYRVDPTDSIIQIPSGSLPLYWDAASHLADSVRVVEMRLAGWYWDAKRQKDVTRIIYHKSRLLNAGMLRQQTCGSAPLGANNVVATRLLDSLGVQVSVHVTWDASLEEAGGEKDVATYVFMRRPLASTDWEILGNIVASGAASYVTDDFSFKSGQWVYGIVAQDCSPANSPVTASGTVTNP